MGIHLNSDDEYPHVPFVVLKEDET